MMDLDAARLEAILVGQGIDCSTQESRDGTVLRVNGKDQHGPVLVPLDFPSYVKAVKAEAIVTGRKARSAVAIDSLALSFVQDGVDGAATQFALEAELAESSLSVEKALPTALSIAIPSGTGSYVLQRLQISYASVPVRKGGSKKRK
ncbi:hypothetical protein [Sphingobium sp. YR768]|uniref:hypothetical protein n=1 Tax=Sphingobium sp. YR768 TaxID=1884365 RepID=UPI00115FDA5D|nr:hypothetical protein [Sphingobium sp. YR768]